MKTQWCRVSAVALALVFVLLAFAGTANAGVLPYWLKVEKTLDNTVELGAIAQAPNQEFWLLERTSGLIRVYVNGIQSATLTLPVYAIGDSGLLGVAFAPDYALAGQAFVLSVDGSRTVRVDTVNRVPAGLSLGALILNLGTASASGLRPVGGIAVGPDGMLDSGGAYRCQSTTQRGGPHPARHPQGGAIGRGREACRRVAGEASRSDPRRKTHDGCFSRCHATGRRTTGGPDRPCRSTVPRTTARGNRSDRPDQHGPRRDAL